MLAVHEVPFTSRGDPLRARLWLPGPATSAVPRLVWVTPPLGDPGAAELAAALCERIAAAGAAAASLDLPLQGSRASRKLTAPLLRAARSDLPTAADARLLAAFREQVAADLAAGSRALAAHPAVAGARLACLALDPGGDAASAWADRQGDVPCVRCAASDVARSVDSILAALLCA